MRLIPSDVTGPERLGAPARGALRVARCAVPLLLLAFLVLISLHTYRALARPWSAHLSSASASTDASATPDPQPIAPLFTPSVQRWAQIIGRWAARSGLPPDLIATVIQIESCGDPSVISAAGALGLMQVMPYHFDPQQDPLDPAVNGLAGVEYLRQAYQRAGGDISLALAGYNGGHAVIAHHPASWPAETQRYVRWGAGIFADALAGRAASLALEDWLAAGGHSLCRRAEGVAAIH